MIDALVNHTESTSEKIVKVIEQHQADEFGYFLEHDPELQIAYEACMKAAGIEWTDEEVAECVYHRRYDVVDKRGNVIRVANIDPLMQYWRQQQALLDTSNPEHARAAAIHIAVKKFQRSQPVRAAIKPYFQRR
jgi:hypothetical protein